MRWALAAVRLKGLSIESPTQPSAGWGRERGRATENRVGFPQVPGWFVFYEPAIPLAGALQSQRSVRTVPLNINRDRLGPYVADQRPRSRHQTQAPLHRAEV